MWLYDTATLARVLTRAVVGIGLRQWYFVAADYVAGTMLVADETRDLATLGAHVAGSTRVPLGTTDFSAPLLQAQGSGADVILVATFGQDAQNLIKQAAEFNAIIRRLHVGRHLAFKALRELPGERSGPVVLVSIRSG